MSKKNNNKKVIINEQQREKQELVAMRKLDPTNLKQEVYQLRQELNYLLNEKSTLEASMEKNNEKYMKESFEIQKTTKIQQEQLTDLENNYKLLKNTFDETRNKVKIDWEIEMQALQKRKNQEKETILRQENILMRKIEHLKQFKTREVQYLSIIDKLKQKQAQNIINHQSDLEKIKNQHSLKRNQIKQTTVKQIQTIKEVEVNKLEAKMNKEQQIKKQNELVSDEIALCESEKKLIQQEFSLLSQQNAKDKSNPIDDLLGNQASETYQRSLRVIKLQNKLIKLKQYLEEQTNRLDNELKAMDKKSSEAEKEMDDRISKLQSWLKLKEKDLKKMKACSQMVLNQRSNLESYLLEVFHQHSQLDPNHPANINQILRFLFTKINSKKPPISYKDYLLSNQQSQVSQKSQKLDL